MAKRGGFVGFIQRVARGIGDRLGIGRGAGTGTKRAEVRGTATGEVLDAEMMWDYERRWNAREAEKKAALRSIQLNGVKPNTDLSLVNVDPSTGLIRPERGGNLVLTLLGDVQTPPSQAALERRLASMRGWKSVEERMQQSEENVAMKLAVIDYRLVSAWKLLGRAQRQYLINQEHIFDVMNQFTFSTKTSEVRAFRRLNPDLYAGQLDELTAMIEEAAQMVPVHEEGNRRH